MMEVYFSSPIHLHAVNYSLAVTQRDERKMQISDKNFLTKMFGSEMNWRKPQAVSFGHIDVLFYHTSGGDEAR
jgi:hypothetical protein